MVQVRKDRPIDENGELNVEAWLDRVLEISGVDTEFRPRLRTAYQLNWQVKSQPGSELMDWGEAYTTFAAGIEMAEILAELQLDADTLVAAILYRSVREEKITKDEVAKHFDDKIVQLIDGVQRMAAISNFSNQSREFVFGQHSAEQYENIRKMLVAIVDDVRVALIKLAERTCAIRAVKNAVLEKRQRVAKEVAEIYAPLAHRLGIGHIKWELEDLSFRYLQPFDYKYIAKLLDERRVDRQTYIDSVVAILNNALQHEAITAEISGRAKHIYSIWRKMKRKGIGFEEVYDIRAVRILVHSERDCYAVLGVVHALWHSIPKEFDDYIANPKENGYRSLHTAVKGPANRVLEIQIRTYEMHEEAEYGVCAHWRYKDTDKDAGQSSYEQKIEWLRQVLEWHEEVGGNLLHDHLVQGVDQDRIYVFTPDGHVIDLPESATPVDFAFRIHSDIGTRCRGAKVNGRIVPLNHTLHTADQVEILKGQRETPSRDWLNPALGYITTSRARSRLQHWFRQQDREQNVADGRALLDREFRRLAVEDLDFEALVNKLNLKTLNDLYAAVGTGDLGVERVINAAQKLLKVGEAREAVISLTGRVANTNVGEKDVYIDGVGNLLSHIAQCCKPIPGDRIAGYITQGRGVSIHRQDCTNLLRLQNSEPERIISVSFGHEPSKLFSVDFQIEAFDRSGLLRDVTAVLDREHVNVSAMQTLSNKNLNTVDMTVTVEVQDLNVLSRVLAKLSQLPNIASVRRKL